VIPIFQPHYKYAKHIITNLKDHDIYFVFTYIKDYEEFPYPNEKHIILEKELTSIQLKVVDLKKIHPSFKKILALSLLYEKYDYICCLDAEIKILKTPNLKQIYENKTIIGGLLKPNMRGEFRILNFSIFRHSRISDFDKLKELSNNGRYYTWWSVMPVYKSNTIPSFLKWIGFNDLNNFILKDCNLFFENMAYNYYCLLYENFKKIIIPNLYHSLEFSNHLIIQKSLHQRLGWINNYAYQKNKSLYENHPFIYMVYHLDRTKYPQFISKKELYKYKFIDFIDQFLKF
jgi:hypothetical protein